MPSQEKLLEVIAMQTEVAALGLELALGALLDWVVRRTWSLVDADGAALEMAEGADMVYRAAAGMATD
ncbi:GGDEF domain-containing protein, partial [Acinetobacter baumannii]